MPSQAVIGIQWGDEGKGKIIDRLSESADVVVRCQGGNNAGHTVVVGGDRFILNLIPCGILHPDPINVIGNGVVIDPEHLTKEIETLEERGIGVEERLFISARAHLILPLHRRLDHLTERFKAGQRIGTTGRGIGPTYADKAARIGIRAGDTLDEPLLRSRVRGLLAQKNPLLSLVFEAETEPEDELCERLLEFGRRFRPLIADAGQIVREAYRQGRRILFEGAQGTMLDLDAGTYPYVTSSCVTVAGICAGSGLSPRWLDRVTGVAKAYATRVGEGPFPSELQGEMGERLREAGHEYGATTGRPRRCGWFDAVAVRYALELNGVDELMITNLDVLSGFGSIQVAEAYRVNGGILDRFPGEVADLAGIEPVLTELPGWDEDISGIRRFEDLPEVARSYVEYLEKILCVPISLLSVGPERTQIIEHRGGPYPSGASNP